MAEYIRRELAKKVLCDYCRYSEICERKVPCPATEAIDAMPAADVAPVVRGKWIDDGGFKYKHGGRNSDMKKIFGTEWRQMLRLKCSECNKTTLVDDTIAYEYCPHCGAAMKLEEVSEE